MKGGIRLRHPELRSCMFVVLHHRPYKQPYVCPVCRDGSDNEVVHYNKAIHLQLNAAGEVVVSYEAYELLRELDGLPLLTVGPEPDPEPQQVVLGGAPLKALSFSALGRGVVDLGEAARG